MKSFGKWMYDAAVVNWKPTLVGLAQLVNGVIPAVMIFQEAAKGVMDAESQKYLAMHVATFMLVCGVLQQLKGLVSKQIGTGSDRPQEVVDQKLDNVRPFDGTQSEK